jgi:hypothetical protein
MESLPSYYMHVLTVYPCLDLTCSFLVPNGCHCSCVKNPCPDQATLSMAARHW